MNKGLYFINIEKYGKMTSSQLWEKETRKVFWTWIFAFVFALVVLTTITISQISYFFIDKNTLIKEWIEKYPDYVNIANNVWRSDVIDVFLNLIIQLTALGLLCFSLFKCIKEKTYKYISFFSTFFIFIQVFYSFFGLIRYAINSINLIDAFNISWVYILQFIMMFVYPFIWFFISRNVGIIRRISMQAEMREQIQNKMNNAFGMFEGNDPFGVNKSANTANNNEEMQPNENSNDHAFYIKLKALSRNELNEIASKLSISGYEYMSDQELMKIITDIRNAQNSSIKEKEFKVEEKNDDDKKSINDKKEN